MFNICNIQENAYWKLIWVCTSPISEQLYSRKKAEEILARVGKSQCWWECKLVQPPWKPVQRSLKQLKVELPFDPAVLPRAYAQKTPKDICTLFIKTRKWNQPRCLLIDGQIGNENVIYIYNEVFLSYQEKWNMKISGKWIDLEITILRELTQTQDKSMFCSMQILTFTVCMYSCGWECDSSWETKKGGKMCEEGGQWNTRDMRAERILQGWRVREERHRKIWANMAKSANKNKDLTASWQSLIFCVLF